MELQQRNAPNLYDAHKQWRSRPADEAVYTIEDLLARTSAAKAASKEITEVPWKSLNVMPSGESLFLTRGGGSLELTNFSMGQLCGLPVNGSDNEASETVAPAGFMTQLSAHVAAQALHAV